MAKITSLILKIEGTNPDIILTKDNKKQSVKVGDNTYELSIQDMSFHKKMYTPGEIIVDMQLSLVSSTEWVEASKADLAIVLLNKKVTLMYGDIEIDEKGEATISNEKTICNGYYIHELEPRYQMKRMYVTLKIYSTDKQMTLIKDCKTWVAKRLFRDIVETEKTKYKLPYKKDETVKYDYDNIKILTSDEGSQEEIFPYLVQYNESYYDFLVRTCNRWGEFLYFEDETLNIGYNEPNEPTKITTWDTLTYCDLNEALLSAEGISNSYADDATHDNDILKNPVTKGEYDILKGVMGCDFENKGGDIWLTKLIGNLLSSGKNLFDFVVDSTVDEKIVQEQAKKISNEKNKNFDDEYFKKTDMEDVVKGGHYGEEDGKQMFNQYALYNPAINSATYKTVVLNELETAKNAVCINFDTAYQDLKLGDIFTIKEGTTRYIVVEAGTKQNSKLVIEDGVIKTQSTTTYYIVATAKNNKLFFPTVHPKGHIRTSGPQRAMVTTDSMNDPQRQSRVKVRFQWQASDEETPWLEFTRPGGNKGTGSFNRHYESEEVLVAFANDNLERPYVVGALSTPSTEAPVSTYTNDIVHVTPGGQAIKMSDGWGSGFSAFAANFMPGWKLVTGFLPGFKIDALEIDEKKSPSFEGYIELSDKYGMYSIKGSTDGRNVTIKSPYGDVKLSAFTGITISAPNGDVKIQGKNVTIEAGNNLTLNSGKFIKERFLTTEYGAPTGSNFLLAAAAAIEKKIASTVGGFLDLSILRHATEVLVRPVEGKLTVKSNRYLALEAGKGKTAYPVDAFDKPYNSKISQWYKDKITRKRNDNLSQALERIESSFFMSRALANTYIIDFASHYTQAKTASKGLEDTITGMTDFANSQEPCNKATDIINTLWTNPDSDVNATIGFKNLLTKDANSLTDADLRVIFRTYRAPKNDNAKQKAINNAVAKITKDKNTIISSVTTLANSIKAMRALTIRSLVENNLQEMDADAKAVIQDIVPPKNFAVNDTTTFKKFLAPTGNNVIQDAQKKLARKMYVALVDFFKIPREKVGAVNGIGGAVPAAPDPYDDNIEVDWNAYVESIQTLVKKENTAWADTALASIVDPIAQGITGFADDIQDYLAFGPNKSGKILFSDGGATKILNKDMDKAHVRDLDDPDLMEGKSTASALRVRNIMKI